LPYLYSCGFKVLRFSHLCKKGFLFPPGARSKTPIPSPLFSLDPKANCYIIETNIEGKPRHPANKVFWAGMINNFARLGGFCDD
jgi:hypothetical protein